MQRLNLNKIKQLKRYISTSEDYANYIQTFVLSPRANIEDRSVFIETLTRFKNVNKAYHQVLASYNRDIVKVLTDDMSTYLSAIDDTELEIFYDLLSTMLIEADESLKNDIISRVDRELATLYKSNPSAIVNIAKWTTEYILIKDCRIAPIINLLSKFAKGLINFSKNLSSDERYLITSYLIISRSFNGISKTQLNEFLSDYKKVI